MEEGRWYIVYLDLDEKSDRLFASNRVERHLQNDKLSVAEGDEVSLLVWQKTDLGYTVIINHAHKGLVFENEIFQDLHVGEKLKAYVKKIRDDNKIDISLQPIGYNKFNDANSELIFNALNENQGFLPLTDKSSPEAIYSQFGISKKAFKKSIGALYKLKKILIETSGIRLLEE
jgi:predicted RNA-binding protein (virulence factor B family)